MQELAHAVHDNAISGDIQDYYSCPPLHHPGYCSEGEVCAFIEGWASFLSAIVPTVNPWTCTYPQCERIDFICLNSTNIETNNWLDFCTDLEGQEDEGAVATILYDLYDGLTPFGIDDADGLSEDFSNIYETLQRVDLSFSIIYFSNNYLYWVLYNGSDPDWEERNACFCNLLVQNKIDTSLVIYCEPQYICGDANGDGNADISDAIFLINYIFKGGPAPDPLEAGDANCDGSINVADTAYLITYVFKGGPEPCCP
jgi:hypothetical protein